MKLKLQALDFSLTIAGDMEHLWSTYGNGVGQLMAYMWELYYFDVGWLM